MPNATSWSHLETPVALLDAARLRANLDRMQASVGRLGAALRPHVKTAKCVEVARLHQRAGARGITVSTLYEAEAFADHGFDDITWAFPLSLSRLSQVESLARRVTLGVVIDSTVAADALARLHVPLRVWMKIDCGYHRCGVDPHSDAPVRLAERIAAAGHSLFGLLSHSGDAYAHAERRERRDVAEAERATIVAVAASLRRAGFEVAAVSVGSTPSMTAVQQLDGVTEARPGNYVYFDKTQVDLGTCELHDCAATVLAQVVSSQTTHAVIDAGALALSKDAGIGEPSSMGGVFVDLGAERLDPHQRVTSLSQEHGKLARPLPVGTLVRVLPNHSCLTVACFDSCHAVRGDHVVDHWRIFNGR